MADSKVRQFTDLFSARSGSDAKSQRLGRLDVPGTSTFELAKGPARIYYTEMIGGGEDDAARFDAPEDLQLAITDANGAALPIRYKNPSQTSASANATRCRAYLGRVEIPDAGSYTVTVTMTSAPQHEPYISLG